MTVRDAAFRTMFMLLKEIDVGIYLLINSGVTKKKKTQPLQICKQVSFSRH